MMMMMKMMAEYILVFLQSLLWWGIILQLMKKRLPEQVSFLIKFETK